MEARKEERVTRREDHVTKRHISALHSENWSKGLNALDEGDESILEETQENGDELHVWCKLE